MRFCVITPVACSSPDGPGQGGDWAKAKYKKRRLR